MGRSVAANILQVDGILHLSGADTNREIAGLVNPLADAQLPAAIRKHLRHEWQLIEPTVGVQCILNLLDLHPVACTKPRCDCFVRYGLH